MHSGLCETSNGCLWCLIFPAKISEQICNKVWVEHQPGLLFFPQRVLRIGSHETTDTYRLSILISGYSKHQQNSCWVNIPVTCFGQRLMIKGKWSSLGLMMSMLPYLLSFLSSSFSNPETKIMECFTKGKLILSSQITSPFFYPRFWCRAKKKFRNWCCFFFAQGKKQLWTIWSCSDFWCSSSGV